MSRVPLEVKVPGTSLFMSAVASQKGCPETKGD